MNNSPQTLFNWQNEFFDSIVFKKSSVAFLETLKEGPILTVSSRLNIYQEAYLIRMLETFTQDFAILLHNVGINKFKELVFGYLEQFPSTYSDLGKVGINFPPYLYLNSKEMSLWALEDWMRLNSESKILPEVNSLASILEIERGMEFKIKIHPTLCLNFHFDKYYLSVLSLKENTAEFPIDELQSYFKEIKMKEYNLLTFLEIPNFLEVVLEQAFLFDFSEEELSHWLFHCIKKGILICEKNIN